MDNPLTQGVRPFSRDRLMLLSRDKATKGAMALLNTIQDEQPEVAVASVALLFATWCRRVGLDPHDAWQLGRKLLEPQQFHRKGNVQAEVLRDFAGLRIMGDSRVDAN
jgi:hypothetical protein